MIGDKNLFANIANNMMSGVSEFDQQQMMRATEYSSVGRHNQPWKPPKLNNRSTNLSTQNNKLMTKSSNNFTDQSK